MLFNFLNEIKLTRYLDSIIKIAFVFKKFGELTHNFIFRIFQTPKKASLKIPVLILD